MKCKLIALALLCFAALVTGCMSGGKRQSVELPAQQPEARGCTSFYAMQCAEQQAGSDIGEKINSAVRKLPSGGIGGTVLVPPNRESQCYIFSTPIILDRPVTLVGQASGIYGRGTCLAWGGKGGTAISVTSAGATGSILENLVLENASTGTGSVGIDIDNNVVEVTLRDIYVTGGSPGFSTAGIRIGNDAKDYVVTDVNLDHVEADGHGVGLQILRGNHIVCTNCKFFGNKTANVVVGGDAEHQAAGVFFWGGAIEPNGAKGVPSVIINNALAFSYTDGYGETEGTEWLRIPKTAINAKGINIRGGYWQGNAGAKSGATNIVSVNLASATVSVEDIYATGYPGSSNFVASTSARRVWLNNLSASDANISLCNPCAATFLECSRRAGLKARKRGQNLTAHFH